MNSRDLTPLINDVNIMNVRQQIALKKNPNPYRATIEQGSEVLTDYDSFPYKRWWRGIPTSTRAIVAEREAGWRPRHDNCYGFNKPPSVEVSQESYPNHCFQSACNTVYPCYPEYIDKHTSRNMVESLLNKACIVQYR